MDCNSPLNIVLVGDPRVGKSTLISKCHQFNPTSGEGGFFTRDFELSSEYAPTSLLSYLTSIYLNKEQNVIYSVFRVNLIDTGGRRRYDHVRPLAYINADVFLLCFDTSNRDSFLNISSKWLPEIRKYEPKTPVILVGTKTDVKPRQVTEAEIKTTSKALGLDAYIELPRSYYSKDGWVSALFDEAVKLAFTHHKRCSKPRLKEAKQRLEEQRFDVTTLERASDPPECPKGSSTLADDWQATLHNNRTTDVILKFPDQSPDIFAHKFVLALASTTFRRLFQIIDTGCQTASSSLQTRNSDSTQMSPLIDVFEEKGINKCCCCCCCINSERSVNEVNSSVLKHKPFVKVCCAQCRDKKAVCREDIRTDNPSKNGALPIQITFKSCIKRPVFLCVLEWMYTGKLEISRESEMSFVEDVQRIVLELDIQPLKWICQRVVQQKRRLNRPLPPLPAAMKINSQVQNGIILAATRNNSEHNVIIPIPPSLPPLPPPARNSQEQNGNIPTPPPLPLLLPSTRRYNAVQPSSIPIPPPLPPLLPSVRRYNGVQQSNIPIPPPLPPLLPSVRRYNGVQPSNISIPPPLPPLLPSARRSDPDQCGNIAVPIPIPLPPILPPARRNSEVQYGTIPIPPPLPPLLPSVRRNNQEQCVNIAIPRPIPPSPLQTSRNQEDIPTPPPLPPLLPSARRYNGSIPTPPLLPPARRNNNGVQFGNIPTPPPLPPLLPSALETNQNLYRSWHSVERVIKTADISATVLDSVYKDMWRNVFKLPTHDIQPDLVLIVDSTAIPVHRVVLVTRSSVMAAMLDGSFREKDLNKVNLPGVSLEHFRTVLEFLYSDTCVLDRTNVKYVMELADRFDIPSLMERCGEFVIHTLENTVYDTQDCLKLVRDSVMETIDIAETFNAALLHRWCLHFIATNYDLFEQEEDFRTIWTQNEEYMESIRWPTPKHIQVLKRYKGSKKTMKRKISRRNTSSKCACCIM